MDRSQPCGRYFIQVVALEGYEDGFDRMVEDVYRPAVKVSDSGSEWFWIFHQRRRVFIQPMHYDGNGKPFRCEECEKFWAVTPNKEDEILLEATDV